MSGLIGTTPMPAYKKRKLTSITNLGSWIKSKGSKKLKIGDYNKKNIGHFIILLFSWLFTSPRWICKLPICSLLYEAKQLPYSIQLEARYWDSRQEKPQSHHQSSLSLVDLHLFGR
jgi:hypothetical protein